MHHRFILKIGLMTTWNVSCGISLHSELVARCWVDQGHDVTVLAPYESHRPLHSVDEPFVKRCYTIPKFYPHLHKIDVPERLDEKLFLLDYDVFVVEGLGIMPMVKLLDVWERIRHKTKTVHVVHEAYPPIDPLFKKFEFDAVVCFDERYKREFLNDIYPEQVIHVIFYPCSPLRAGVKDRSRKDLELPLGAKIVFNYGIGVFRHLHLLPVMENLSKRYPLQFLVVTEVKEWLDLFTALKSRYGFIELRKGPLSFEELYKYLHASDLLLIHRDWGRGVVLSSMIHKCLGALCPILVHDTNFVEDLARQVIKYHTIELSEKLVDIFEQRPYITEVLASAKEYVEKRANKIIADKFLKLFSNLNFN